MSYSAVQLTQQGIAQLQGADKIVSGAVLDSRLVNAQVAFIARKGKECDGHDYLEDACQRGARLLFIEEKWAAQNPAKLAFFLERNISLMLCKNGDQALFDWASWQRSRLQARVLALSGSYGKTTTKELLSSVLKQTFKTFVSEGNLNSLHGVALSLIAAPTETEVVVFECGIDHCGEMDSIAALLKPQDVLLTAIGDAHLQAFGSQEIIAYEKSRLFQFCRTLESRVFLPKEDKWFSYLCEQAKFAKIIPFPAVEEQNMQQNFGYRLEDNGLVGSKLCWAENCYEIALPVYKKRCLEAAWSVAEEYGCQKKTIIEGLRQWRCPPGRGEIEKTPSFTLVHDYYNAPTSSVFSLLTWLASQPKEQRYLLVLADILELGEYSESLHQKVGELCPDGEQFLYFFFGKSMKQAQRYCRGVSCYFSTIDELVSSLNKNIQKADVLILKGSRGMQLENAVKLLKEVRGI